MNKNLIIACLVASNVGTVIGFLTAKKKAWARLKDLEDQAETALNAAKFLQDQAQSNADKAEELLNQATETLSKVHARYMKEQKG